MNSPQEQPDSRHRPDRPVVAVGVVVQRGNSVLLVRRARAPMQGAWSLPGGAQELGESLFDAARREVAEETGISCQPQRVITAIDSIWPGTDGRPDWHYTIVEILAQAGEDAHSARPMDDVSALCWLEPQDAARRAGEGIAQILRAGGLLDDAPV